MFRGTFVTKLFFTKFELQTVKAGNGSVERGIASEPIVANVDVAQFVIIMLINEPDKYSANIKAKRKKLLLSGKKGLSKAIR